MEPLFEAIAATLREHGVSDFAPRRRERCAGGCINDAFLLRGENGDAYFVKTNAPAMLDAFEAEADALAEIAATRTVRCPVPRGTGEADGRAFIVLEAIAFGRPGEHAWRDFGERLAEMHRHAGERFGWHRDNVIGENPQRNTREDSWAAFFRDHRLAPQFELARRNGRPYADEAAMLDAVPRLLAGHEAPPSLLHGDLWTGNADFDDRGQAVIFDPASYHGDRETDLAFSEFFGGFPRAFYEAYHDAFPIPEGYERRKTLYNLYHTLNHANLFGGGYASAAEGMIRRLL